MKDKKVTTEDKVKKVNQVLQEGEPENITTDPTTQYTGYKPQYIIDAMNSSFGIGKWGFEEIENTLTDKDGDNKPKIALASVRVFIKGIDYKPQAHGQSRVTRGDYGDAKKGAQTDAIKKALSYFSIGNRAYHGKLNKKSKNSKY